VQSWVQYSLDGLWKLEVSTSQGNLGFPLWQNLGFLVDTKLGVYNKLSCSGSMSLGEDLEIVDFVDVVGDDNDLR
jgi:hypothetical protein